VSWSCLFQRLASCLRRVGLVAHFLQHLVDFCLTVGQTPARRQSCQSRLFALTRGERLLMQVLTRVLARRSLRKGGRRVGQNVLLPNCIFLLSFTELLVSQPGEARLVSESKSLGFFGGTVFHNLLGHIEVGGGLRVDHRRERSVVLGPMHLPFLEVVPRSAFTSKAIGELVVELMRQLWIRQVGGVMFRSAHRCVATAMCELVALVALLPHYTQPSLHHSCLLSVLLVSCEDRLSS